MHLELFSSLSDADKQKECAAGFEDLGKRMEELGKDMSDEDKAKWGKEMAKALLGEIPGA